MKKQGIQNSDYIDYKLEAILTDDNYPILLCTKLNNIFDDSGNPSWNDLVNLANNKLAN